MRCVSAAPCAADMAFSNSGSTDWVVRHAFAEQLEATEDGHKKIVEVVGDAACEASDGFEFLRLEQHFARLFELALVVAPFRDIARNFGEANKRTGVVAYGVDNNVCPEMAAVLADTQALLFEATFSRAVSERVFRLPG